jgi:hypothetical protein
MVFYDFLFTVTTSVVGAVISFIFNSFINIPFQFLQQSLGL